MEGDINNINKNNDIVVVEGVFPEKLLQSVEEIIKEEGYIKYKVSKTKLIANGVANFFGELYDVKIKGETKNRSKESNVFVKIIVPIKNHTIVLINEFYIKECYFYKELSKILAELQDDAKIPVEERYNVVKSYNATNIKAIFLENLAKKGFQTVPRMKVFTLEFAELAVKHLAKFHGLFYVLQRKQTNYFDIKLRTLKHSFTFNEEWGNSVLNFTNFTSAVLTSETNKRLQKFIPTILKKYATYWTDTSSVGCTVCHGDYRKSNILVKYTNGKITNMIPVDYQFLHYGSPLKDFMHLIFSGTDQIFRKNHLEHLKNLYYDHLNIFLGYFDFDLKEIYATREEFEKRYREMLEFGFINSLYLNPFVFAKDNDAPDVSKDDLTKDDFGLGDQFRVRMQGIIDDFIQWGYL